MRPVTQDALLQRFTPTSQYLSVSQVASIFWIQRDHFRKILKRANILPKKNAVRMRTSFNDNQTCEPLSHSKAIAGLTKEQVIQVYDYLSTNYS